MKKRLAGILACCTVACAVATTVGVGTVLATSPDSWSADVLESTYNYNDTIQLEDRTYTYNNQTYTANHVVTLPDGSSYTGNSLLLDKAGKYTVNYSVQAGEKVFSTSDSFIVEYPTYYVSNSESSATYGTPDKSNTPGVITRLVAGDSLTFTKYIDMNSLTGINRLVEGYIMADNAGSYDFTELLFTFSDSVDPSIYFQVRYKQQTWEGAKASNISAGGENQELMGYHHGEGKMHIGDGFGLWSWVSFKGIDVSSGTPLLTHDDKQNFYVAMDYQTKEVYGPEYSDDPKLVCNLANPDALLNGQGTTGLDPWLGLPSGKARLTVSASGYQGSTANFCITSVCGLTAEDFVANEYVDNDAPVVTVESEYGDTLPYAVKGFTYEIPKATAYDEYAGAVEVQPVVWFHYGKPDAVNITVEDGRFKTDKVGVYSIVYEAYDALGNYGYAVRNVVSFASVEDMEFEIPAEKTTTAHAGEWVTVPQIESNEVVGGSGNKAINIYVEIDGNKVQITDGFRAEKIGTYKVIYEAIDYVGESKEMSYNVTVSDGGAPVLATDYDLLPAYISDGTYKLPEYKAYFYSGNKLQESYCDIVITDANGTKTYKGGDNYKAKVNANGDAISFVIQSRGETLAEHQSHGILAYEIAANGQSNLKAENYFLGENLNIEKTDEGFIFSKDGATDVLSFTYANIVDIRYASVSVTDVDNVSDGAKLTVKLTDAYNSANYVSATITMVNGRLYLQSNGESNMITTLSFNSTNEIALIYTDGTFTVGGVTVAGKQVEFTSDKALISIELEDAGENAQFTVKSLSNTNLTSMDYDRGIPFVQSLYEDGGTFDVGSVYTIRKPVAYDLYSPNVDCKLTVLDGNGDPVKDVNGLVLEDIDVTGDYQIKLDTFGSYNIAFVITESEDFLSRPNKARYIYGLNVYDYEPPVLNFTSKIPTTAKVGDTIVFPTYSVSDNAYAIEDIDISMVVETPKHQYILLPGNALKVTQVGEYTFRLMAVDKAGNISTKEFKVTVTEGDNK